jgi:ribosomal protein S6
MSINNTRYTAVIQDHESVSMEIQTLAYSMAIQKTAPRMEIAFVAKSFEAQEVKNTMFINKTAPRMEIK